MYQKTILPNGIRIVSESLPYIKSVTIGLWIGTGSSSEEVHNQGISHFIEHLLFKGTTNRSARDIAEAVDAVGGQLNAFTAKEHTCYYVKVLDSHTELAIDILSDMLLESKFDSEDISREREVILEEVHMYEDTPDDLIHDLHVNSIWGGHPLGCSILGTTDTIQQIDRNIVKKYYNEFYTPDNLVIAAAGNIEHLRLVELVNKYFEKFSGSKKTVSLTTPVFHPVTTSKQKKIEQVHLCLGTESVPLGHPDLYAFHIVNTVLGGSVSSRLFQSVREERGLAYSIYTYQTNYHDAGLFSVYVGTRPHNLKQVIELVKLNIADLRTNGVSDTELSTAKEQLKGNLLLSLESSSSRMSRLGTLETIFGKYYPLDDIILKIDQVKLEDILRITKNMFTESTTSTTLMGPIDKADMTNIEIDSIEVENE